MKAVNLLPNDQRGPAKVVSPVAAPSSAPAGDGFGAYLILGALALAVVAVAATVMTKNTISDRKAELAQVQTQVDAVAREAAALKPYADFKQLAEARVQTVTQLATSRFDWEQALRDLSHALPRDVRLAGLKGDVRGGGAAAAPATPGAATAAPSIEISGCTSTQTSVAKLMARLRAVRGVTRVSLKSSAKAATGGAVTSGAAGGALCRKSGPTFALTIHFERFGVPPVSTPLGAAGGAPAGATGPTGPTGPTTPAPGTTSTTNASATQGVSTP